MHCVDHGVDLEPDSHDPGVLEQPGTVLVRVRGDDIHVEPVVGRPEVLTLVQDRQPGPPGLIDLEDVSLEQVRVFGAGKRVLIKVMESVHRWTSVRARCWPDVARCRVFHIFHEGV